MAYVAKYGPKPKPARERFFRKVTKTKSCWLWFGTKNNKGYGSFMLQSPKKIPAHRAAWLLEVGEIPAGMCVLHKCDTPACVNPKHLFLGTQADNMADMRKKGRHRFVAHAGSSNGNAKLSDQIVQEILALLDDGFPHKALAERFGVSRSLISHIATRRGWAHVSTH